MSEYRKLIDGALFNARSRLRADVPHIKTASAPMSEAGGLVKEANELANALEYLTYQAADNGSASGAARSEMIRDFFKTGTGNVSHGPTTVSGTQQTGPAAGKKKLNVGTSSLTVSEAPEGEMGRNKLKQEPPAVAKSAGNLTLYDILMSNKEAGRLGGPSELEADQAARAIPHAHENANRRALIENPASATKAQARKPTRARLAEVFSHTGDTLSRTTASRLFPQAAAKGGLKEASASYQDILSYGDIYRRALDGELGKEAQSYALQVENS